MNATEEVADNGVIRKFGTGATRDTAQDKPDYEGFLSPLVLERYGAYMHKHRKLPDGSLRDSANWQLGLPQDVLIKSGWRHFMDWWKEHRGLGSREGLEDALCALLFNTMGYLHNHLVETRAKQQKPIAEECNLSEKAVRLDAEGLKKALAARGEMNRHDVDPKLMKAIEAALDTIMWPSYKYQTGPSDRLKEARAEAHRCST